MNHANHHGLIVWPELKADHPTIWRWQQRQGFPKPIRIDLDQMAVDHDQVQS